MIIEYSDSFREGVRRLSSEAKKQLKKKLELMVENPRHPSLRSKKIQGIDGIFEASVNMDIRMTWQYTEDGILLRKIGEHEKTLGNP
jgi:mRNA interferase RelE/StbE